jgi:hypothetical protein
MTNKTKTLISILGVVLVIGYVVLFSGLLDSPTKRKSAASVGAAGIQTAEAFAGGTFEASGIAQVAGTDGFLFVDDGKPGEVLWIELDKAGKQSGSIVPVKLGVNIDDPEGITTDGSYFYVVGSLSRPKSAEQAGLARFRFNKDTKSAEDVQSVNELKRYLVENVAELRGSASKGAKDDDLNIEGLAWDPDRKVLLLGLRNPVIDGKALLVPLKMRDPRGTFSSENLVAGKLEAIRLPIAGMGIRSIEYDDRLRVFHIIGGATEGQDKTDFKLWEWSSQADGSGLRETTTLDRKLQPEGVTGGSAGNGNFKVIVFDSSRYLKMQ